MSYETFDSPSALGKYWSLFFTDEPSFAVLLHCSHDILNEYRQLETPNLTKYLIDTLHFALSSYLHTQDFWGFLLSDTYFLQQEFAIDQVDLLCGIVTMLETFNAAGYQLPRECYSINAAILASAHSPCTALSKLLLTHCRFEYIVEFDESAIDGSAPMLDDGPCLVRDE